MSAIYSLQVYFDETTCCKCGAVVVLPNDVMSRKRKDGSEFFCYNGHSLYFDKNKSSEQKLRDELAKERRRKEDALRRANEARAEADKMRIKEEVQRKSKLRMKNRIKHGVCPCCNRTFKNLQNHMKTKHKDFVSNRESLQVIRTDMELSQTKLAKSLDIQAGYVSSYEHNKYLPEYAKDILDKFVEENG